MALLDLSTLELPNISKGNYSSYKYFIITEQPHMCFKDDEFVFIPGSNKTLVANLYVIVCETNILKMFYDEDRLVIIPAHDVNEYGRPIFTRPIYDYELKEWECPENFFWSDNQALAMLDYIKKKCGYIKEFDNKEYSLIQPYGHFNKL